MQPSSGSGRPPVEDAPPGSPAAARRISGRLWAAIGAFGVLGTVGAYVTTLALDSARDRLTEPLAVDVRGTTSSPNYLFPLSTSPQDAPIEPDDLSLAAFRDWATAQQGIPYMDASLELVLRGRDPETVVVQEIAVRVLERSAVPAGGWVNAWDGCGAALPTRLLTVDFAPEPPDVDLFVDGVPSNGTVFGITQTEVEVFDVEVRAGSDIVSWVFEVRYSSAGRDGVITVDDAGDPFRIAGGGNPAVFSTLNERTRLTQDDVQQESLARGGPIC